MRAASRSAPVNSSLHNQLNQTSTTPVSMDARTPPTQVKRVAEKATTGATSKISW